MKHTPLYEEHKKLGAKFTEFANFEMPVEYKSILAEHLAVRNSVGIFDVSHMGKLIISGENAIDFVAKIFTYDLVNCKIKQLKYGFVLNEKGIILDDMIFYRLAEKEYLCIPNASTIEKIYNWFVKNGGEVKNLSDKYCIFAVQGKNAQKTLQKLTSFDLATIKYFWFEYIDFGVGKSFLTARSGYTGEDGFEIIVENEFAVELWNKILNAGKEFNILPCGLGCRDTLRMEKGFFLSGHDFNENKTAIEVNGEFAIKWNHEFIGKEILLKQKEEGNYDRFVGILLEKGIPREGYILQKNGKDIGKITSGTMSPSLRKGIALGFVKKEFANIGEEIDVVIRDKIFKGKIVKMPFL